jgi:hypothetical protein
VTWGLLIRAALFVMLKLKKQLTIPKLRKRILPMSKWHNLYLYSAKTNQPNLTTPNNGAAFVAALGDALTGLGYTLYDPFKGIGSGIAYAQTVKHFVAPANSGWTRILGVTDDRLIQILSQSALCLSVALDGEEDQIAAYWDGDPVDTVASLTAHLRSGLAAFDLQRALDRNYPKAKKDKDDATVPMDVLPADVQAMAEELNPQRVNKMFNRFMQRFGKGLSDDPNAARDLLNDGRIEWESPGGQRIEAVMACLTIGDAWREPDFVTVRDAHQLKLRHQHTPNAPLFPGDEEAMAAVPNALDYSPVYGGIAKNPKQTK